MGLSTNLGNSVDLGRLTFSEIFVQPPVWLLYSFLDWIFLQLVVLEKKYRKQKSENEYCEICGLGGWKFDSGEVNPHWLCEELKLFLKYWSSDKRYGLYWVEYIQSRLFDWVMFFKAGLELFDNEIDVKYGFIFELKKIIVVEFHFRNKHKQEIKNKQTKRNKKSKLSLY